MTGTVYQRTAAGRVPLPFAFVSAISATTVTQVGQTTAGPDGRFTISGVDTDGDPIFVFGGFAVFSQPCAVRTTVGGTGDVDVVSQPVLSGTGLPADLTASVNVSGTVSETVSGTVQPAAFAYVNLILGRPDIDDAGWTIAGTLVDANGAYQLCNLPSGSYTAQAELVGLYGEAPANVAGSPLTVNILLAPSTSNATGTRARRRLQPSPLSPPMSGPARARQKVSRRPN